MALYAAANAQRTWRAGFTTVRHLGAREFIDVGLRNAIAAGLTDCHNIDDFRALAKRRVPWPVFDYIDGAADDAATRRPTREAFDGCDLIPRGLEGVESIEQHGRAAGGEKVYQ